MKLIPCLTLMAIIAGLSQAEEVKRERPERPIPGTIKKEFDRNGDGVLSDDERADLRETMRERRNARRNDLVNRFDADGDGELNEAERATAHDTISREMLAKYDADGDGALSRAERKAMVDEEGYNPLRFANRGPRAGHGQRMGMKPDRGAAAGD